MKSQKWESAIQGTPFSLLSHEDQKSVASFSIDHRLSFQSIRKLIDIARDLDQWQEGNISQWLSQIICSANRGKDLLKLIEDRYEGLKTSEKSYANFRSGFNNAPPDNLQNNLPKNLIDIPSTDRIIGPCPVASPKTRCCNLLTLDTVRNCPSQCSYCAIQSFFKSNDLMIETRLTEKLERWVQSPEYDPKKTYHLGTGQSSDSLKLGNKNEMMSELFDFVRSHPNIILELKTKSASIEPVIELSPPSQAFCSWSLNPQMIISQEEHLTASLDARIKAARKAADAGIKVGFHLHPISHFAGWQTQYQTIAELLQQQFQPHEVVCVSLGTLTFIKSLLPQIRKLNVDTKVLQMPFVETAGKLSYPLEIKKELFRTVYRYFKDWHHKVYFYLCMESPELWKDVFDFEYATNEDFEKDMFEQYRLKLNVPM